MVGLSFAVVQLYRLFCQITGFGGTTQVAKEAPGSKSERRIDVRFDANVAPGMPWSFTAPKPVTVRLGEQILTAYAATNTGDQPVFGVATFNVVPEAAGRYFSKIQCFCFTEQVLMPGESKEFPLVFFVDPAIAEDRSTAHVSTIALSYTFFNAGPEALRRHLEKNPAVAARGSEDRRVP
jgi:cytochrome c oxidase assembly protein subunit 11